MPLDPANQKTYDDRTEKGILGLLDTDPPEAYRQWNGSLLAKKLGDVSGDQVWRILRKHKIQLQRRRSWCLSTDPEFGPKAAGVVGLYLSPPENSGYSAWTKSLTFRFWSEPRDGCGCLTAKP
jgi:hypothetical protein